VIARAVQSVKLRTADAVDAVRGRHDPLVPPRRLTGYVGNSDFRATGEEFLGHFRALAGLNASDRVLDVGCGIGRMARVLVGVLRPPGSYDGFDIVSEGIAWCRERYRDTPAPFRFQHADLHNATYNPAGTQSPVSFAFPYPDGAFDLVLATSVFTHLLADAADHYLAEAARVTASGGRLFATWYLLSGEPPPPLRVYEHTRPAAVQDPSEPEALVAFEEGWLRERLSEHGLRLRAIHPGTWNGGPGLTRQDIVIADRP
jgi:SAM-dependent methyltransferase